MKVLIGNQNIHLEKMSDANNLCDIKFSVNGGVVLVKDQYFIANDINSYGFKIDNPTRFTTLLSTEQYRMLTMKLMESQKPFMSEFIPNGYLKGQNEALWSLTLEFAFESNERIPHVTVENFQTSFGVIKIDDINCDLSHAGGSSYDYTKNWNLVGANKLKAMKHLVVMLTKRINNKVA